MFRKNAIGILPLDSFPRPATVDRHRGAPRAFQVRPLADESQLQQEPKLGLDGSQLTHAALMLPGDGALVLLTPPDRFTAVLIDHARAVGLQPGLVLLDGQNGEYEADLDAILAGEQPPTVPIHWLQSPEVHEVGVGGNWFSTLAKSLAILVVLAGMGAAAVYYLHPALWSQAERQLSHPLLYALRGYLYCDLLLAEGEADEVLRRAEQTLEWMTEQQWLLFIGLDHLSLGRAHMATSPPDLTAADIDAAVRTIAGTARSMGLKTEGVE